MGGPRRHHYLPVFYMSAWCGADQRLTCYRKDGSGLQEVRIGPKDTAVERDLYAFHAGAQGAQQVVAAGMEGSSPDAELTALLTTYLEGCVSEHEYTHMFEKIFNGKIDSTAAAALHRIRREGLAGLTAEERIAWARFMMYIPLRSAEWLERMRADGLQAVRDRVIQRAGEDESDELEAMLDELLASDQEFQALTKDYGLWLIEGVVRRPDFPALISAMYWWTMEVSRTSHSLLTCDRPFCPIRPLSHPRSVLYVPVGPRLAFFASHDRRKEKQLQAYFQRKPKAVITHLNSVAVRSADRWVYATDGTQRRFIENRWLAAG
jgi:hypothetical protein